MSVQDRAGRAQTEGPDPGAGGVSDAEGSQRAQGAGLDPGRGGCLAQIAEARAQDDAWGYRLSEQDMRVLDTLIANYEAR